MVDSPPTLDALLAQEMTTHRLELPEDLSGDDDGDGYTNLEAFIFSFREN